MGWFGLQIDDDILLRAGRDRYLHRRAHVAALHDRQLHRSGFHRDLHHTRRIGLLDHSGSEHLSLLNRFVVGPNPQTNGGHLILRSDGCYLKTHDQSDDDETLGHTPLRPRCMNAPPLVVPLSERTSLASRRMFRRIGWAHLPIIRIAGCESFGCDLLGELEVSIVE